MNNQIPFQAGGPLLADSPVYVVREAENTVTAHLERMEYITLIEPRQQGKTSLLNYLMGTLPSYMPSYIFAYCDLMPSTDQNQEGWYRWLGEHLYDQLKPTLSEPDWHPEFPTNNSSCEKFFKLVAKKAKEANQKVVIVLDEIGAISPKWVTSFFSLVRSVYTSRQAHPDWNYLTFVMAGAVDPRTLIKDKTVSGFNVDQRVPLEDFNLFQVTQLVAHLGLSNGLSEEVGREIFRWTDGQPYLTQMLCLNLAEDNQKQNITDENADKAVEKAVDRFFQEDTQHLTRIRDLAKEPKSLEYLLSITRGNSGIEFNPVLNDRQFHLAHIMGVIKSDSHRCCQVRNQVYKRALTIIIREHIPESDSIPQYTLSQIAAKLSRMDLKEYRKYCTELLDRLRKYDESKLKDICFALEVDYDNLSGSNRSDKARELIIYLEQHDRLPDLIEHLQRLRKT